MAIEGTYANLQVVGTLKTMNLEARKSNSGKDMINGNIVVQVEDVEKGVINNINIKAIEMKENNYNGEVTENKRYKGLQTIMEEYKTIDADGLESADTVSVSGNVSINDYVGQNGLVSRVQFNLNYMNRVDTKTAQKAEFSAKMVLVKFSPVLDEEQLPVSPAAEAVEAYMVNGSKARPKVTPLNLIIHEDDKGTLEGFKSLYTENSTGELLIKINNYPDTTKQEEVEDTGFAGFGKKIEPRVFKNFVNELEIIGGNMPLEEGLGYSLEEIQEIINMRRKALSLVEEKSSNAPEVTMPTGFPTPKQPPKEMVGGKVEPTVEDVNNGDIPTF